MEIMFSLQANWKWQKKWVNVDLNIGAQLEIELKFLRFTNKQNQKPEAEWERKLTDIRLHQNPHSQQVCIYCFYLLVNLKLFALLHFWRKGHEPQQKKKIKICVKPSCCDAWLNSMHTEYTVKTQMLCLKM